MLIMVVDDEVDMIDLFKQRFRKEIKEGLVNFVFHTSAEQALQDLKSQVNPDLVLILSDINMPGMNGLELLRILKKEIPTMKVMLVTAYGDDENYQQAMRYGADGFINKPIDFNALKNKCLEVLGGEKRD